MVLISKLKLFFNSFSGPQRLSTLSNLIWSATNGVAANPWMKIDLQTPQYVSRVVIRNRLDSCCIGRVADSFVFLQNSAYGVVGKRYITPALATASINLSFLPSGYDTSEFVLNGLTRYVWLKKLNGVAGGESGTLNIQGIDVYNTAGQLVSGGKTAFMSSQYLTYGPATLTTNSSTFSHTDSIGANPGIMIDLVT